MDKKKVREAIAKEKETIKTLEDVVVSDKTGSLRRWAKDTIENSTIIIETLEKQLPKKVDIMDYLLGDINFRCPVCKSEYICEKEHEHFYCPTCGQKLDWTVEE